MRIFLFLLFIFVNDVNGQHLKVSYTQSYNYDFEEKHYLELYINAKSNASTQITHYEKIDRSSKKKDANSDITGTIDRKVKFNYLLLDLNKKNIQMYYDFARRFYEIEDSFPEIKWQLVNESKEINIIKVQKAIGKYRGKKWEVWFAPSIPYSFGPWKLNGLPGLIIAAKDENNNNYFQLNKIEYDSKCIICDIPEKLVDGKITQKDFLLLQDDLLNNLGKSMSRNMTLGGEKINFLDLETEFEFPIEFSWETKK